MKAKRVLGLGLLACVLCCVHAAGTKEPTVSDLVDDAAATYNYVVLPCCAIASLYIAWRMVRHVWDVFVESPYDRRERKRLEDKYCKYQD